ncbi:hypothetical protein BFL28_10640 [Sphingomonas turrisvirgatae]|uniref:Peptidase n=1 Tax=Sphingomonas turrisvirgatae TaxID=1888892 RepID=A0A1E3LZP1_9SPHN|nr:hypothetical protein BFL28_10640 [Sphingomonas turrisvirgatae]
MTETTEAVTPADAAVDTAAAPDAGGSEGAGDESTILGGDAEGAEGEASGEEADKGGDQAAAADGPPEAYELTAPEGMTLDEETLAEADPVFRELGLSNEAAQKLVPIAAKFGERIAANAAQSANQVILNEVIAQRKEWAETAKSDPEMGGAKWDETIELSAKALDALGYPKGSPFRSFLTDSGLGNHPEMIRAMRKIGGMVSEDGDFPRGDMGAPVPKSREEILYPNDVKASA